MARVESSLWGSNEVSFPSFSSASSLDETVPIDDVLGIFVMSSGMNKSFNTTDGRL